MEPNTLSSALNTIAQCAAALAALIGFFGLWRLERLQERMKAADQAVDALVEERTKFIVTHLMPDSRNNTYGEQLRRFDQRLKEARARCTDVRTDQQRLMAVLVCFLLGTLACLAVAIMFLAFTEELCTWVWPMRVFIVVAGLWLGGAPAYIVLHAAGRGRAMEQRWSRLRYQIRRPWRRLHTWRHRAPIVERLRGQWLRLRRGEGAPIRERVQWLARVIEHAGTRLRTWHGPTQIAGWLRSQWRRKRRKDP